MRKRRKIAGIVLALTVVIGSIAGCGSVSGTENVDKETERESAVVPTEENCIESVEKVTFPLAETKTFKVMAKVNSTLLSEIPTFAYVNERCNISFDLDEVMTSAGDATEKIGLSLASGDYPDAYLEFTLSKDDIDKYGEEGVLIPLENLIRQHAPNLATRLDEKELWQYLEAPDGHVYELPSLVTGAEVAAGMHIWLNTDWLNRLGMSMPASLDELHSVFTAFKEQDANGNGDPNDEIPVSVSDGITGLKYFLPYFGVNMDALTMLAVKDDQLTYLPTSETYKDFLRFFATLYQEGLLDENSFTQNGEQLRATGSSEEILGCYNALASFLVVERDIDEHYETLTPFEGQSYPINTGIEHGGMVITEKCENPEVLVAWADQWYSEEGGILYWLGLEGDSYLKNEDGTWSWNTDGPYGSDIGEIRNKATIKYQTIMPAVQPEFWYTGLTDPDESYLITQRSKLVDHGEVPLPAMNYSEEDSQTIASLKADLDTYINQYGAQVITGEVDLESSWQEYLNTMNAMGAEELTEIYRAAYEKAVAN